MQILTIYINNYQNEVNRSFLCWFVQFLVEIRIFTQAFYTLIFLKALCVLGSVTARVIRRERCDTVCLAVYQPVCGKQVILGSTIYKTFGNDCELDVYNCLNRTSNYFYNRN